MSLPMPPPEVVEAACAAMARAEYPPDVRVPVEDYEAPYYLQAIWPHLYAAALRDAADRIDDTHSLDGGRGWDTNTDVLRAYADEAAGVQRGPQL